MKTKIKTFATIVLLFIFPLIFIMGCLEELDFEHPEEPSEPYILSPTDTIFCDSPYFIWIKFEDSELYYSFSDSIISSGPSYSSGFGNMIGRGYSFRNKSSSESAEVGFYKHEEDSTFIFQIAKYRFGNPWYSISGASIQFFSPADSTGAFYRYLGTNATDSSFRITWLDESRICGQFKAKLVECCGGDVTYWVEGEFSIPRVVF
ncbi:MAG: hypothetical protein EA393_14900 [Bacteroidetes bacterium]|nr:MAG: hypothetical protein EA393_14900 [Bacteroidota bacterium]